MSSETTAPLPKERVLWVTSTGKPVDHALTDVAMAAGMASRGVYLGLCGIQFFAAPMTTAPGPRCTTCWRFLRARASLSGVERHLGVVRARRLPVLASCARFLAALFVSDSSVVPRPASAAADTESPAGTLVPLPQPAVVRAGSGIDRRHGAAPLDRQAVPVRGAGEARRASERRRWRTTSPPLTPINRPRDV